MSTLWCLENESRGHRLAFILCLLGLLAQYSSHSSAEPTLMPSSNTTVTSMADNQTAVPDLNTTTANTSVSSTTAKGIDLTNDGNSREINTVQIDKELAQSDQAEKKHGAAHSQTQDENSKAGTPVVFTSVLVCGLLAAAGILAGSYMYSRKRWTPPSRRLDEETDAQDRDSVMFSVAAEDRDKPKVNGEAQETGEKSPPASAAGTAQTTDTKGRLEGDTEL